MASGKIRPSIYMGSCMAAWAVVSACTATVHNYAGLVTVRFLLGVTEAPFYPGALYLLSIFYTRKEIATRIAILYSGNILATSMAGLIAAATFASIDGAQGLKGWQWYVEPLPFSNVELMCWQAFPHRRRRHLWCRHHLRIPAARFSSHNSLADRGRTNPC
jgi:MFS family permease